MKTASMRTLPMALSLALGLGVAVAQTNSGSSGGSGSSAGGQSTPAAQPATGKAAGAKLARADRKFMEKAAADGMFEVQASQLASTKASDPNVKSFASKLADDHTAANKELAQIADSKGVKLPAAPTYGERRTVAKLDKQSGTKFDDQYVRDEIKDHQQDIKDFQKASAKVKDPDLKAWIDKTMPALREHLAMAQKLPESGNNAAAMGNSGATTSGKKAAGSKY